MTHLSIRRWITASVLAVGLFATGSARADEPKITFAGLIDWYYQMSFAHPPAGSTLTGRSFDVKSDSFSLSLAEVNIVKPVNAASPIGFTATLTVGKTADLVSATEPGGTDTYKYLQQLYGTYLLSSNKTVTLDFGKFVTALGAEVIESSSNDNYTRSFLFNYAIPFYHAGLRLTYPLSPTLTGQLQLVNGWNNVEDDNGGKTIGGQLAWNPNPAWSWLVNYMGGDESTGAGFAPGVTLNVQALDLVGFWKATTALKLGINADYVSAAKSGRDGGHWSGYALYGKYQLNAKSAVALRFEHFEDSNGLRTGAAQNLHEYTATYEYVVKNNLVNRVEFRHDRAGTALFPSGGGLGRTQDTLLFSQVYKF